MNDFGVASGYINYLFRQFQNGKFVRIAHIHRTGKAFSGVHHPDKTINHVVHITETAGLAARAINGNIFVV